MIYAIAALLFLCSFLTAMLLGCFLRISRLRDERHAFAVMANAPPASLFE